MNRKSNKIKEAEAWVDNYIKLNNNPPTYEEVAQGLVISKTAAYARCRFCRKKMKQHGVYKRFGQTIPVHPHGLRPIYAAGHAYVFIGYLHHWVEHRYSDTYALVEDVNGKVFSKQLHNIEFLDMPKNT